MDNFPLKSVQASEIHVFLIRSPFQKQKTQYNSQMLADLMFV